VTSDVAKADFSKPGLTKAAGEPIGAHHSGDRPAMLPALNDTALVGVKVVARQEAIGNDQAAARFKKAIGFGKQSRLVLGVTCTLQGPKNIKGLASQCGGAKVGDQELDVIPSRVANSQAPGALDLFGIDVHADGASAQVFREPQGTSPDAAAGIQHTRARGNVGQSGQHTVHVQYRIIVAAMTVVEVAAVQAEVPINTPEPAVIVMRLVEVVNDVLVASVQ
jgi:hypothetical protein